MKPRSHEPIPPHVAQLPIFLSSTRYGQDGVRHYDPLNILQGDSAALDFFDLVGAHFHKSAVYERKIL